MTRQTQPEIPADQLLRICNRCDTVWNDIDRCQRCQCPEFRLAVKYDYAKSTLVWAMGLRGEERDR